MRIWTIYILLLIYLAFFLFNVRFICFFYYELFFVCFYSGLQYLASELKFQLSNKNADTITKYYCWKWEVIIHQASNMI